MCFSLICGMVTFMESPPISTIKTMKRLFVLFSSLFILLCAFPNQAQAQCSSNADSDPSYTLPSGSSVCESTGKLQCWIVEPLIEAVQPTMALEFPNYTFQDYVWAYYRTEELKINYLSGTWSSGQTFKVSMGGSSIIIIFDGL